MTQCSNSSMKGGRRRKHRKSRSSRSRRGGRGDVAANAAMLTNGSTSGTSYVNSLLGDGIKQWENVFVNGGDVWDNGNQYTLADNTSIISQADILAGGKRRRKGRGKRTRGRSARRSAKRTRGRKGGECDTVVADKYGYPHRVCTYGRQ